VIVRDTGDAWQVVLQIDHADLSGAFARAWKERGRRHDSLQVAAARHDDGWAVWERAPRLDESGKPVNFLDVDVRSHLAFYRACIAAVAEQDAYAGMLVSMHGAGIYRQRYGLDPALALTRAPEVQELVDAFVAEQEAKFGGEPGERHDNYALLQVYDRLSLYFCMRDVEGGEAAEFQGYRLEPLGGWRARLSPYPFGESPATFSLVRRRIPKGAVGDVLATPPEQVAITLER
jgi:Protein of unknown function (DUF3891)